MEPPAPHPALRDLRNALEHLGEAEFSESNTTSGPRSRSLRNLPGEQLFIGTYDSSDRLFGLITGAELEAAALSLRQHCTEPAGW